MAASLPVINLPRISSFALCGMQENSNQFQRFKRSKSAPCRLLPILVANFNEWTLGFEQQENRSDVQRDGENDGETSL